MRRAALQKTVGEAPGVRAEVGAGQIGYVE